MLEPEGIRLMNWTLAVVMWSQSISNSIQTPFYVSTVFFFSRLILCSAKRNWNGKFFVFLYFSHRKGGEEETEMSFLIVRNGQREIITKPHRASIKSESLNQMKNQLETDSLAHTWKVRSCANDFSPLRFVLKDKVNAGPVENLNYSNDFSTGCNLHLKQWNCAP